MDLRNSTMYITERDSIKAFEVSVGTDIRFYHLSEYRTVIDALNAIEDEIVNSRINQVFASENVAQYLEARAYHELNHDDTLKKRKVKFFVWEEGQEASTN